MALPGKPGFAKPRTYIPSDEANAEPGYGGQVAETREHVGKLPRKGGGTPGTRAAWLVDGSLHWPVLQPVTSGERASFFANNWTVSNRIVPCHGGDEVMHLKPAKRDFAGFSMCPGASSAGVASGGLEPRRGEPSAPFIVAES